MIHPVLRQMASDGVPYRGFLYAGLALTADGPQVIEFNVRLGDPETQAVLPRLKTDLVDVIEAALAGGLDSLDLEWHANAAVNVVLAASGYPEAPRKGDAIHGAEGIDHHVKVFHGGTARDGRGRLTTAGGRVLSVVGMGDDVVSARDAAYGAIEKIEWDGMFYRRDIALS